MGFRKRVIMISYNMNYSITLIDYNVLDFYLNLATLLSGVWFYKVKYSICETRISNCLCIFFFPLIPSYILQMYVAWDLQLFIDICDDMFNIQPWQIQPKPVLFSQLTVNELLIKWFYYKCTKQTGKIRRKKQTIKGIW